MINTITLEEHIAHQLEVYNFRHIQIAIDLFVFEVKGHVDKREGVVLIRIGALLIEMNHTVDICSLI